ncbi:hypothetical protein ACFVYA_24435 [Amycolatopsis sp. NPDC058278]|uniref:hypothetical protein n=1 Tax=Amycolatopsis sp. NPDC058278 TaxID=3346417 RepID=UPI0036DCF84D
MTRPLPNHPGTTYQITAHRHRRGSDHDPNYHSDAEDGRPNGAGGTNKDDTSDGDRGNSLDSAKQQPDTDRRRPVWQGTTEPEPEQAAGGSAPPKRGYPPVTLTPGPDGALWVTVDGADLQEVAAKIGAICDALLPATPVLE